MSCPLMIIAIAFKEDKLKMMCWQNWDNARLFSARKSSALALLWTTPFAVYCTNLIWCNLLFRLRPPPSLSKADPLNPIPPLHPVSFNLPPRQRHSVCELLHLTRSSNLGFCVWINWSPMPPLISLSLESNWIIQRSFDITLRAFSLYTYDVLFWFITF